MHQNGMDFAPSTAKVRSGFIAQEVDSIAQLIGYDFDGVNKPSNDSDNYTIGYATFVVPLVKAVQELSKAQDSLMAIISGLTGAGCKTSNSGGNNDSVKNIQNIKLSLPDVATLGDAQPNPNNGYTQISYYIPDNISKAKIVFTDMLGKILEEKILQIGYGLLNIDTQDLPIGIYTYSLLVDGKVIDNKKMIRNK